ncbi:MAG TPA: BON domain-containing protein [Candidatus Binatus sp.]|uniref:BON domain-containing protein n=1 Tax=Candidatus Binatus sp. TaxID=2811406 RepID=UPI002B49C025|nr:BON domain-containing protein [Candidatus Binatus sp.]HKN15023.1 BON domain-containing protein [Candidatus Binatus sp.]
MKVKYSLKPVVPAILLGMVLSIPAFAQDQPAIQSMHQAGEKIEQAGSDTAAAAKDAYHGTERAVKDTAITAKVKTALARDKNVSSSGIHVDTVAGVVTLKGSVPSPEMAQQAAQLAEQTEGVKSVNNQLLVITSANAD